MQLLFAWVVFSVAAASIARSKNRSAVKWALVGLVLGPFAILIVALMDSPTEDDQDED